MDLYCDIHMTGDLAERLVAQAARYQRSPVDLLADIITKVIDDDLIDAVLDEKGSPNG